MKYLGIKLGPLQSQIVIIVIITHIIIGIAVNDIKSITQPNC